MTDQLCEWCGKSFASYRNKKFCSDKCRWKQTRMTKYYGDDMAKLGGKGCRDKGARTEREVCHIIEQIAGDKVSRNLEQTREGGADVHWGPFALEVKARQTIAMPEWQRQVREAVAGTDKIPAVVYRRNGEDFWISLPFSEFLKMFTELRDALRGKHEL